MNTQAQTADQPEFELLRELAAIIDGIPAHRVVMRTVVRNHQGGPITPNECGTVGCALGWGALHPEFSKKSGLGVAIGKSTFGGRDWNSFICLTFNGGDEGDVYNVAAKVFKITYRQAERLFQPVPVGLGGSDKEAFRRRVVTFLRKHGQKAKY